MKTIETIAKQLTDSGRIMQDVRDMLMQIDPQFPAEEARYTDAAEKLKKICGKGEAYLAAREAGYVCAIIYLAWQGIQLNVDLFYHPVHGLLLHEDFEQLCQEEKIAMLPAHIQAQQLIGEFYKSQPEEVWGLLDVISDYYAHLETVGYKIAHYFGYRLADVFLGQVIPGYACNPSVSGYYSLTLSEYLQIDLCQLN